MTLNLTEPQDVVVAYIGSFSPPTVGHLYATALAMDKLKQLGHRVRHFYIVPTHQGYGKNGLLPGEVRLELCRLMAESTDYLEVDPTEVQAPKWSRTIETLKRLESENPGCHVAILCGVDLLGTFATKWIKEQVIEILDRFGLLVVPRRGSTGNLSEDYPILSGHERNIITIQSNVMEDVSSTIVRDAIANGNKISGLVIPAIEKVIVERGYFVPTGDRQ